jgi:hypothetical protein
MMPPLRGGIISAAMAQLAGGNGGASGTGFFRSINSAALERLDTWVPRLLPMAVQQPGRGAWRVSSRHLGRPLQEDLSIAPNGIVDFGVADMGDPKLGKRTPIDLVLEFGGKRDAAEAALWLCECLGLTPGSLGWRDNPKRTTAEAAETEQSPPPIELFWHGKQYGRELRTWLIQDLIPETGKGLASGRLRGRSCRRSWPRPIAGR